MMAWNTLLFRCACCGHDVRDHPDRTGRDRHLAPVCRGCERAAPSINAGAFADRRKIAQIHALSTRLDGEARAREWSAKYASA